MVLNAYKNKSAKNTVNPKLETVAENITFYLKGDTDVIEPTLYVSSQLDCNYIKCIDGMGQRSYFVNNQKLCNDGTMILYCHVDVLNTYWNDIEELNCLISRQEKVYSNNIIDTELTTRNDKQIQIKKIGVVGTGYKYYLTVAGGVN